MEVRAEAEAGVPHLLSCTSLNPGAVLLAPIWGLVYRVPEGFLVLAPAFAWSMFLAALGVGIPGTLDAAISAVLVIVPALIFGMKADALAWRQLRPGSSAAVYRRQQLWWVITGVLLIGVVWLLPGVSL